MRCEFSGSGEERGMACVHGYDLSTRQRGVHTLLYRWRKRLVLEAFNVRSGNLSKPLLSCVDWRREWRECLGDQKGFCQYDIFIRAIGVEDFLETILSNGCYATVLVKDQVRQHQALSVMFGDRKEGRTIAQQERAQVDQQLDFVGTMFSDLCDDYPSQAVSRQDDRFSLSIQDAADTIDIRLE